MKADLRQRSIMRKRFTLAIILAALVGMVGITPPAHAITGTNVYFNARGVDVPDTAKLIIISVSEKIYRQTYETTRNNIQTTCPPSQGYRLEVPAAPGTRVLLGAGVCKTWQATGTKQVGLYRATTTPPPPPPPPPTSDLPDATNTGFRGDESTLTDRSGYVVRTAGTVLDGVHITDTLTVDAPNVTIRNCVIDAGFFGVEASSNADGLTVEDCTIRGGGDSGIASTSAEDVTVRRNNVSGGFDGMKIAGTDVLVEGNYIHDLASGPTAHNDGIQVYGSATRVEFLGNAIWSRDTSGIAMFEGKGFKYTDVTVSGNFLTGAGYLLYAGGQDATGMTVTGNTFGDWGWGPVTEWNSSNGNTWANNVDLDGQPINP